jgi:hypothetical protein
VVTTLPPQLRPLARFHPREIYDLLFSATANTLLPLATELGFRLGVTTVLHTWTREGLLHPHVHAIVTAGGLSFDDTTWIDRSRYLFPEARMKAIFRAKILAGLDNLRRSGIDLPANTWNDLFASLPPKHKWVLFIEAPLGTSTQVVVEYLGRYVQRIAISDQRLISITDVAVTFRTRGNATVTISPFEFIRRFLEHALPSGLRKIRHFGLYAPSNVTVRLEQARQILSRSPTSTPTQPATSDDVSDTVNADSQIQDKPCIQDEPWVQLLASITGHDPLLCPCCKKARLERKCRLPRSPP